MIIYQKTNNWCKDKEITSGEKFLFMSQYYATKEEAFELNTPNTHIYKITIPTLGREEIAAILNVEHVSYEHSFQAGQYHEIHNIEKISQHRELIKWKTGQKMQQNYSKVKL